MCKTSAGARLKLFICGGRRQLRKPTRSMRVIYVTFAFLLLVTNSDRAFAIACTMTATSLNFGTVDVTSGSPIQSSGTLSLSCSGSPISTIRMCVDMNGGSSYDATSRKMLGSGADTLRYQIYSNASYSVPWGSWSLAIFSGGYTWDVACSSANCTATRAFYGQIPTGQAGTPSGSYSSSLGIYFTYNNNNSKTCPNSGVGNSTTTTTVLATVATTCSVVAADINFGSNGVLTSDIDATSSIQVTCNGGTNYQVSLSAGTAPGATTTTRKMTSGADFISYFLYRNSTRTANWGNNLGVDTVSGVGSGSAQALTIYGRVPTQTTPPPSSYSDAIVVTVSF